MTKVQWNIQLTYMSNLEYRYQSMYDEDYSGGERNLYLTSSHYPATRISSVQYRNFNLLYFSFLNCAQGFRTS